VERSTVDIYEDRGEVWAKSVTPVRESEALSFGAGIREGAHRIDIGCGAGRYTGSLGRPCVGLDAARSMLDMCRTADTGALLVQADIEALPFGRRALGGAWANMSYLHIPKKRLPAALADLHRTLEVGAPVDLQVLEGEFEGTGLPEDRLGGRFFAAWDSAHLEDVVSGAGFDVEATETHRDGPGRRDVIRIRAKRARTLPDTVGPGMRLLVCGLNPSLYSADAGMAFARKGNRFWTAATSAGLVTKDRDPRRALEIDGVGMTDMVKRASTGAAELTAEEYRRGAERVERMVEWLQPAAVCFVGLAGWRAAVDRSAVAGPQDRLFGGRPAYVMPSTSGANAHSRPDDLASHLANAIVLADESLGMVRR
jgi:TDG/mug DNA glycosylase family protein